MEREAFSAFFKDRLNIFYALLLIPLLAIELYRLTYFGDVLGVLIPLYGFLILLSKKDVFSQYLAKTVRLQQVVGLVIVVGSFFVYFALVSFVPWVGFYGIANYVVYLFGMFLVFFNMPAFRETVTAFFLIIASGSVGVGFRWIESQISPTVPYYVYLFSSVLNVFGVKNTVPDPTTIFLDSPTGVTPVLFEAGCIGVYSLTIFSVIIVVTMMETSAARRTKLVWAVAGSMGVFIINIIRLLIVVTSIYFYGYGIGQQVHQVIGYVLFLSWLGLFLLIFAKRQIMIGKIQIIQRKIMAWF